MKNLNETKMSSYKKNLHIYIFFYIFEIIYTNLAFKNYVRKNVFVLEKFAYIYIFML